MIRALFLFVFFAIPALAQEEAAETTVGTGAMLRGLDKINGELVDYELRPGEHIVHGALTVKLEECRYPTENPNGDAFAFLEIYTDTSEGPVFRAWMVASSPALSALDHPRYDIWVLRCTIE